MDLGVVRGKRDSVQMDGDSERENKLYRVGAILTPPPMNQTRGQYYERIT